MHGGSDRSGDLYEPAIRPAFEHRTVAASPTMTGAVERRDQDRWFGRPSPSRTPAEPATKR